MRYAHVAWNLKQFVMRTENVQSPACILLLQDAKNKNINHKIKKKNRTIATSDFSCQISTFSLCLTFIYSRLYPENVGSQAG